MRTSSTRPPPPTASPSRRPARSSTRPDDEPGAQANRRQARAPGARDGAGAHSGARAGARRRARRHVAARREHDQAVRRPDRRQRRDLPGARGRHRVDYRAQRRGQDDVLQHAHRALQAHAGPGVLRRAQHHRQAPGHRHEGRRGAHLPEHQAVQDDDRDGERAGWHARAPARPYRRLDLHHPVPAPGGAPVARAGQGAAGVRRPAPPRGPRRRPGLRRPAAAGDRPRPGRQAQAAAPRRADSRDEPAGVGRADRADGDAAPGMGAVGAAHRARHEGRHERVGSDHGARLRREDRRGQARGGPDQRARHRGLPGEPGVSVAVNGDGAVLHVEDIHTFYGSIEALKGITIEVREGEIVTLIGSNGAGKSTTLRSISGLTPPREGTITFAGKDITDTPAHEIVKMGISQSPEGRRVFSRMSVLENLEMGAYQRTNRSEIREDLGRVYHLFPRLEERKAQRAGTLSGGEQQMVAIGRALMARPRLLLLDEPSMGLAPIFVDKIFEIVTEISKQGTTILLVEQNALMALETADRGYVLETGTVALADDAKALKQDEQVRKTYLGEE